MYSIQKLPHHITREVYECLDLETLVELSPYMGETQYLAHRVYWEELNQHIVSFHQTLPPTLQRKITKLELSPFSKQNPPPDLVSFMEKKKSLSIDELNSLAFACYRILKQREAPYAPIHNLPPISEALLREMDQDRRSIIQDGKPSFRKFRRGLYLSNSALFTGPLFFSGYPILSAVMCFFSLVYLACSSISFDPERHEGSALKILIRSAPLEDNSPADGQYKAWLEFIHREMTTDQHKLLMLPESRQRDFERKHYQNLDKFGDYFLYLYALYLFMVPFGLLQFLTSFTLAASVLIIDSLNGRDLGSCLSLFKAILPTYIIFTSSVFIAGNITVSLRSDKSNSIEDLLINNYLFSALLFSLTGLYLGAKQAVHTSDTWLPALRRACLGDYHQDGYQRLPQMEEGRDLSEFRLA